MKLTKKQLKDTSSEVMYGDQSHLDDEETDYDYKALGDALIDYVVERIAKAPTRKTYGRYSHLDKHFYNWEYPGVTVESLSYTGSRLRIMVQTTDGPKTLILQATVVD